MHSKEGRGSANTDITDHKALSDYWDTSMGVLWFETPTNPMLTVNDIRKVCLIAHKNNAIVVVDNTFATPYTPRYNPSVLKRPPASSTSVNLFVK